MRCTIAMATAAAVLGFSDAAHACRCAPPSPPLKALEASNAVFSGTVTAVELDVTGRWPVHRIEFDVALCWKGGLGAKVEVQTPNSSAACGRDFVVGVEYLVYAAGGGSLNTNLCDRTGRLEFAQEDLDALGPPLCTTPVESSTWSAIKRIYE